MIMDNYLIYLIYDFPFLKKKKEKSGEYYYKERTK